MRLLIAAFVLVLALALAACNDPELEPTPGATPLINLVTLEATPEPTTTSAPEPTPTPSPVPLVIRSGITWQDVYDSLAPERQDCVKLQAGDRLEELLLIDIRNADFVESSDTVILTCFPEGTLKEVVSYVMVSELQEAAGMGAIDVDCFEALLWNMPAETLLSMILGGDESLTSEGTAAVMGGS